MEQSTAVVTLGICPGSGAHGILIDKSLHGFIYQCSCCPWQWIYEFWWGYNQTMYPTAPEHGAVKED